MTAIGSISSFDRYNAIYQLSLEREVSTVDKDEAENGLVQSDQFRSTSKQNAEEEKAVPFSTYVKRAVAFSQHIKKQAVKKDEAKPSTCPIDRARAESQVGENAPLNWLMADQMGGHTSTPEEKDFVSAKPEMSFQDPAALFVPEPTLEHTSGGTLLSQEWLFTPCN